MKKLSPLYGVESIKARSFLKDPSMREKFDQAERKPMPERDSVVNAARKSEVMTEVDYAVMINALPR